MKRLLVFILSIFLASTTIAQEYKNLWVESLDKFDQLNGESPMQEGILFTGSSSIRFWKNLAQDFNNPKILNRGFGGSQIIDLVENFDKIILQYHPKVIVIYSGDNDIQSGKSAEIVFGDFCMLYGMIKAKLPNTKMYYISIKPSISRWNKVLEMKKTNTMINEFLNKRSNGAYIDVFSQMIGDNGKPKEKLFISDGLHMNREGYDLWTRIISTCLN